MLNRNPRPDPQDPQNATNAPGVSVPAKGDSAGSNPPHDPDATLVDFPTSHLNRDLDPGATFVDPDATFVDASPPRRSTGAGPVQPQASGPVLQTGDVLGGRYEILQLLGEGGMGAVYKAMDRELDRPVALKLIRPQLASNPSILARFKQELLLAHQVTHRNVIRIYDLGDADGVKFITMEFVEGVDLRALIQQHQKFPPGEAVEITEQICRALEATHNVGVIHRDLKPQNIMRDGTGRILLMDFGLARTVEGDGMTQTGALVGTMEYMSPEQALGKDLDQRSDLFTLGLILYELLTGKTPYSAESVVASLIKRNQERAIPVSDHDGTIPKALSNIVSKCLERDTTLRYQNADELLNDLLAWQGKGGSAARVSATSSQAWMNRVRDVSQRQEVPWSRIAAVVILLVAAVAGTAWYFNKRPNVGSVKHAPVSVLVADFQNNTSDPLFDGTLEPMFNVALEGATFINAYNRSNARQVAGKLPNPTSKLDEQSARLVAVSQGVSAIVTGALSFRGNGYRLSVEAIDAVTGKTLATADVSAANKDDLLLNIPKLAAPVRKALGDTTPESVQLAATQGSFATSNVGAVHLYSIGMEQQFSGKMAEALESFSKAAELDPNFARAYAGMAAAAGNLGQGQNAEKYAKLAMEHVDRMTERERYRVRGQYYIRMENWQKCIEEYSELLKQYPADNIGQGNLAACYARMLNMPRAMEEARRGLELAPKDAAARMNFTLYACYATDFQSCEAGAHEVLQLNPAYEEAFLVLAYAQLGQNQVPTATETYQRLEKISPWGASLAASGLGDIALYQGKFREAAQILEKAAATDLAAKNPDAAADKFVMLAFANGLRADKPGVLAAVQSALASSQSTKIKFLAARSLVEVGETSRARKLAESLGSALQAGPQAYAKLILGEAALKERDSKQAIQLFTEARNLMDTWVGRFDLGRAYLEAGAFAEADSEFDMCLKRRGEALEIFMDDMPTYSYLPPVYLYQGRDREGLKSSGFADSYRTYLSIRGNSTEDPLVPGIRSHLGK